MFLKIHLCSRTKHVLYRTIDDSLKFDLLPSSSSFFLQMSQSSVHNTASAIDTPDQYKTHEAIEPQKRQSARIDSASPPRKPSTFQRIKTAMFGPPARDSRSASNHFKPKSVTVIRPASYSPISAPSTPRISQVASLNLVECPYSLYCPHQNSAAHTRIYSHPCRYNELCQDKANEPHLTHEIHRVPHCPEDTNCLELTNPVHRAQYRHTNLPDYLHLCHHGRFCRINSPEHRVKYFHDEELPSIKSKRFFQMMRSHDIHVYT